MGPAQRFCCPLHIAAAGVEATLVPQHMDGFRIVEIQFRIEHIGDDVDEHRSRASGTGNVEGFLQHLGQILHPPHQIVVFGDGGGDPRRIRLLKGVLADQGRGHLAADDHQRDGIHMGRGNAGDHIAHSRPAGGDAHPHLARGPGIAVGGMDGPLFVAGEDMREFRFIDCIVQAQYGTTRVPEDHRDLFGFQTCKDGFCAGHFHQGTSFSFLSVDFSCSFSTAPWYPGCILFKRGPGIMTPVYP